jgi:predicted flap endonuclease-1-like 5' DNA nuclease
VKASAAKPAAAKAPKPASPKTRAVANALAAPRGGVADKLVLIKGIGPVNEKKLNEHGIFHFDQIAAWKKADIEAVEAYLAFDGRIAREDWVGQAKALAKAAKPASGKRGGSR